MGLVCHPVSASVKAHAASGPGDAPKQKVMLESGGSAVFSLATSGSPLEHFPEKWEPVFRRKCDQRNESRA
jgi:hypothetical protein